MSAANVRNLLCLFDSATAREIASARASYPRYNTIVTLIAASIGYPTRIACGVFAALSPNNNYLGNLRNTRTLLEAHRDHLPLTGFKVNTYNPNKAKAWAIAEGADPDIILKGLKTNAFYHNVFDPTDPRHVTVDGHIYWAWSGKRGRLQGPRKLDKSINHLPVAPTLKPGLYHEIADSVRLVGEARGCIGNEAQAVIWQTYRRVHNIVGAAQLDLLAPDVFAAGITHNELMAAGCGR